MATVFISHESKEKKATVDIAIALETAGFSCWYFERDNVPGEEHLTTTQREIALSEVVIFLISKAATQSNFVYPELIYASGGKKILIPIYIDVSHAELAKDKPQWNTALGFSTGIRWTTSGEVIPQIIHGLQKQLTKRLDPKVDKSPTDFVSGIQSIPLKTRFLLTAYGIFRRKRTRVRFVSSVFARINCGGKYFLVKNIHRPESIGPFGGVIKYKPEAKMTLDSFGFIPHVFGDASDIKHDIRGFFPPRNLKKLLGWYFSDLNRESADNALRRELREEFREAKIKVEADIFRNCHLDHLSTVFDGPEFINRESTWQFRIFEIFDLNTDNESNAIILQTLEAESSKNPMIGAVTLNEIQSGRSSTGWIIGSVTSFLIGQPRNKATESPLFEDQLK